ncbi:MAG: C40 family peptidase [Candidatus Dormibacteria bacterium]
MISPPGGARERMAEGLDRLRQAATARYGDTLIEVRLDSRGVRGTVALPDQAAAVQTLIGSLWPGADCRLLVLAARRPRVGLHPQARPLDIWRRWPGGDSRRQELTSQLLPGDPGAGLLAVRGGHYLVRAPGDAVGWVIGTARFGWGPPPGEAEASQLGAPVQAWDPEQVRRAALSQLGLPYVFGGTGGEGVDCSGLVWRAFLSAGVLLPRNSRAQRRAGERVGLAGLHLADIICAVHKGPRRSSHVALSLGEDRLVHACSETNEVRLEPLRDFRERYQVLTVRRVPGATASPR